MCISVILELDEEGATGAGAAGWFDMAVATGNGGPFVAEEDEGKG